MDCREIKLSVDMLLDGDLDANRQALADEHLATCTGCRAEMAKAQALRAALAALPVPAPSADFQTRVLRNAARRSGGPSHHVLLSMALAATLALGVGLGVFLAPVSSMQSTPSAMQAEVQHVSLKYAVAQNVRLSF